MFKHLFLSLALVAALGSVAEAGGNSKSKGSVRFTNRSTTQIALVAVDPSTSLQAATTAGQFTSRGGRILNPGESTEFRNVSKGTRTVATALVEPGTTTVGVSMFTVRTIGVTKGKRTQVNL